MIYKTLNNWISDVNQVRVKATYRAMNKAAAKTKTQFQRSLAKETGLKSSKLSSRFLTKKATKNRLNALVSLGTKHAIPLSEFSPKSKVVRKNKRKYTGVTVKIPSEGGRSLVPGAFMMTVRSGKVLVVARKTKARTPTEVLKHSILKTGLEEQRPMLKLFREEFKKTFRDQLKYEVATK